MKTHHRIVIVGRPNVGKSTLFNRLFGRRRALVHDEPGVTRDRIIEKTTWTPERNPFPVELIDTGGIGGDRFASEIKSQVEIALKEADLVLFVLDATTGITPGDQEVLRGLQRGGVLARAPLIGVINKLDHESRSSWANEFYLLGIENIIGVSAEHGIGIDDLKSMIREALAQTDPLGLNETEEVPLLENQDDLIRLAVVGRPNVGKSTLINALMGENRMITSPIAGTTIDSVDTRVTLFDQEMILIDTAGIRRKSKTEKGIEVLSVIQTRKALERCNVAVLVVDAEEGVTDQDEKIAGLIDEVGCSVLIAVNKWDVMRKNQGYTQEMAAEHIRAKMAFMRHAPILFLSAKNRTGLPMLIELAQEVLQQRRLRVSTKEYTEWVKAEVGVHNPRNVKFYMSHQAGTNPPTFVSHVSEPKNIHYSLKRHIINAIRERWGYMGNPVRVIFRKAGGKKDES